MPLSSYHIPHVLPATTLEAHEDGYLYIVEWRAKLDEPILRSIWLPIGVSIEWLVSMGGKSLLHTSLHRQRDPGLYLDVCKRRYLLIDGEKTKATYRIERVLQHREHEDALEYSYFAGQWWRRTSSGLLLAGWKSGNVA